MQLFGLRAGILTVALATVLICPAWATAVPVVPVVPVDNETCTTNCVAFTGDGGSSPSNATPITAPDTARITSSASVSTSEYWEFFFDGGTGPNGTGPLGINATIETSATTGFQLQLFNSSDTLLGFDPFASTRRTDGDLTIYSANLSESLPAGNYIVGIGEIVTADPCCAVIGFNDPNSNNLPGLDPPLPPVMAAPEPTSLTLLGAALIALGTLRRRRGRRKSPTLAV